MAALKLQLEEPEEGGSQEKQQGESSWDRGIQENVERLKAASQQARRQMQEEFDCRERETAAERARVMKEFDDREQEMAAERARVREEFDRREEELAAEKVRVNEEFDHWEQEVVAEQERMREEFDRKLRQKDTEVEKMRKEKEQMKQDMEDELARYKEEQKRLEREQEMEYRERLGRGFQESLEEEKRQQTERYRADMEELGQKYQEREQLLQAQIDIYRRVISLKNWPTYEEWARAKKQLYPDPLRQKLHCVIAGSSGSGKSSLINALRGITNRDKSSASIGIVETPIGLAAYPHPSTTPPQNRWVWYELPGIGTLHMPGPKYFNAQGLFIFDMIIVVVDTRFTSQDIAILKQCERFKIPSFIVRSKSNQHINNIMHEELGYNSDEEDTDAGANRKSLLDLAKRELIENTARFKKHFKERELDPNQRIYMVSANYVRFAVNSIECESKGSTPPRAGKQVTEYLIDEFDLIKDLHNAVTNLRC